MAPSRALLRSRLQALLVLALAAAAESSAISSAAADVDLEWKPARATHYSAPGDVWTIHDGSCTHKYIWPDVYPGALRCRRGAAGVWRLAVPASGSWLSAARSSPVFCHPSHTPLQAGTRAPWRM